MRLSISLSEDEVASLDRYTQVAGLPSRSAAIQQAIRLLGDPELEEAYAAAWDEWEASWATAVPTTAPRDSAAIAALGLRLLRHGLIVVTRSTQADSPRLKRSRPSG